MNRLNSFQWSLERLLSLAKANLTKQPTAKSSRLKKWKEESQNRRGLSQAANSECTKTFESQEITAVHILQHRGCITLPLTCWPAPYFCKLAQEPLTGDQVALCRICIFVIFFTMNSWLTPCEEVIYWWKDGRSPLFLMRGMVLKQRLWEGQYSGCCEVI